MIEYILNKEQAEKLFKRESVMIGDEDVIPDIRAIRCFGKEAVSFAHGIRDSNTYGLGKNNISLPYLYKKGFQKAVTYHNIMMLQEEIDVLTN